MTPVLVLGEESRVVLPVIRSIARTGVAVDLGWCPDHEPARRSRFIRSIRDLPPATDADAWIEAMMRNPSDYGLVIPATESATWAFHRTRERWSGALDVAIGPAAALDVAFDKAATSRLAASLGVPVPQAVDVEPGDDPMALATGLGRPIVVKPLRSVDPGDHDKLAVAIVDPGDDLGAAVAEVIDRADGVQLQQFVPGHGEGVEVLASEGRILVAFQHRRLHETTGFGSTYRESVALDPELLATARSLVEALDYTGVAMFEFRVDDGGAPAVLLEINPRFWGSLPLSIAAGVDFPAHLHALYTDGRTTFPTGYRVGVRSRDLLNDVRWTWRQVARSAPEAGWATNRVDRRRIVGDLGRLLARRDGWDLYDPDDRAPAWAELRRIGRLARPSARR